MLMQAIEAEVEAILAAHAGLRDQQGRRRVVRNGHGPERQIQTGIGPVEVRRPKVRDRGAEGNEPIRFSSAILPAYRRRSRNIEEQLPWLCLKGVPTDQFAEALTALLGPEAPGLSATTVRRLTRAGKKSMRAGRSATSRPGVTSISGPTASASRPSWSTSHSACWC
jgi:transposase-like protein